MQNKQKHPNSEKNNT